MYFVHRVFAWALLMNVLCPPPSAWAHALGQGYVFVDISDTALSGRVELTLTDLNLALDVDDDGDGKVSELELEAHLDRIEACRRADPYRLGSGSLPPRVHVS